MKIIKNKTKISAITVVLVLTVSAILVALPTVVAHDPAWEIPTWAYISASSNPVGVNQQTVIVFWPNFYPPTAEGAYGDRWTWNLEVTKPDGSKETMGPFTSDPVGGGWTKYTPDQVGTYTIVARMDEHLITGEPLPPSGPSSWLQEEIEYIGDTVLGSSSDPYYLTVQQDPIEAWEETPLPEEYWTLPINSMNREWYRLAGNWLSGAAQVNGPTSNFAYGKGPESAHIMWATPMWAGGIMDERLGNTGYQTSHYHGLSFRPPIILNGKIYYNVYSYPRMGWYCLDLYTGEVDYFHNTTGPVVGYHAPYFDDPGSIKGEALAFGQIYDYESPNQHGGFPYLWSTNHPTESNTWMMFDAYTGNYICSIANVSARGTAVYGKEGSILRYNIVGKRLTVWNTSLAIWYEDEWATNEYWMWRPDFNITFDGNNGFSLNVSIPDVSGRILAVREGEFLIGGTAGTNNPSDPFVQGNLWCLSLEPGKEGTLLWNRTFTPPEGVPSISAILFMKMGIMSMGAVDPEDGVFLFEEQITRKRWGYSLDTMEMLWESEPEASMNYYGMSDIIYDGKLYSYGYSGELIAYNITTGEKLWTYTATNVGFESPYGNYPLNLGCVADGKIYLYSDEHSPTQPLWRGSYLRCIDADTGTELWKINHWGATLTIADGCLVDLNEYDNRIYCYGKGPSATSITIQNDVVPLGDSVIIKGTVTDESPGTKQLEQAGRFPKGVPAVADEYQEDWMEYMYMQQSCPTYYDGVDVKLEVLDPNGKFYEIGTVKSDGAGIFKKMWTPEVEGEYTVIATFEGSKAYYRSYAETVFGVDPAPAPSGPIEPEPTEPAEAPFITTEIAIIAAVVIAAIIGIVAYWALRKRK